MLDFVRTEPGAGPIVVECYFAATPATVFEAWTEPDIVMKWFGRAPNSLYSASIDLRPGGAWQFLESKDDEKSVGFEGEYLDVEPGKRLVFTWSKVVAHANGERAATPVSQVEVIFAANGTGTDVCLIHSAVQDDVTRTGFTAGWTRAFKTMSALFS